MYCQIHKRSFALSVSATLLIALQELISYAVYENFCVFSVGGIEFCKKLGETT